MPRLVEELGLSSAETVHEPSLGGLIEKGETIEEGDAMFWEGVRVLWDAGVVETCSDEGSEGEGDGEGEHGWLGRGVRVGRRGWNEDVLAVIG